MYKFTEEQKAESKALIRELHNKYYLNPIKRAVEERQANEKSVLDMGLEKGMPKEVEDGPKVSYTDVKKFVAGSNWNGSSPRALAAMFVDTYNLPAQASRVRQYVQRIMWELKKKSRAT